METSKLEPQIAIVANAEGLAVAYSFRDSDHSWPGMDWYRLRIHRLDPSTLGSVRVAGLEGHVVPGDGWAGAPGATYLDEFTLHSGYLEVSGFLYGNSITEYPPPMPHPYPIVQSSRFVAIYPDFFGPTQRPPQFVTF